MPSLRLLACFVGVALSATGICTMADAAVIKVACIGEQSTHSHHLEYPQEYPAHLQTLLGTSYEVMNFGDGVGMLTTGHPPGDYSEYVKSVGYMQSLTYAADIVVFGPWGKHDSDATGGYGAAASTLDSAQFAAAYKALLQTYVALPSHPRIILALPIPFPFGATTGPLTSVVLPTVQAAAVETKFATVDLYNLFKNKMADFKDLDHLTDETVRAYVGSGQEKQVLAVRDAILALDAADAGSVDASSVPGAHDAASVPEASSASAGAGGTTTGGAGTNVITPATGGAGPAETGGSDAVGPGDSSSSGCSCSLATTHDAALGVPLFLLAVLANVRRARRPKC